MCLQGFKGCTFSVSYLPAASDGVLSTGKRNATSKGAAGAEDEDDPGQHPAAAGGAETHSRAAAASPGTRDPGTMQSLMRWLQRFWDVLNTFLYSRL